MIQIPIEIGDTILAGRFKNKKVVVKTIETDPFGLPTINGRGILKIRIPKLYVKENTMKKINEGSTDSIPVKIKKEDDRYFIYVQYPDESEKCITNVGFETEDLALHSVTTKGYTLVDGNEKVKPNKFTEPPKAMTQRSNEFKLSEASLKTLKRLIVEVLSEVDVTDPKVEAAIDELSTIEEQLNNAIAQVEALKKQLGIAALEKRQKQIVDEQLWDFLEEMKKDEERVARTKNVLMNLDRVQTQKATYSYEKVLDFAMTQVNQDVKFKILQELKATEKISRVKPSLSFTRTTENNLNEANVFQKVGDWITKTVKSLLGGLKTKGQKIDSDLTKLERILKIS